jgi:L-fucose isomerase-like protein
LKRLRIAFIPLLRPTFDVEYATEMIEAVRAQLVDAGFELVVETDPIADQEGARSTAKDLTVVTYDLLLILQSTFADSTLVTTLAEATKAPIFLWALPEPWTGARLRLNSLCGINLAGHALTLRGIKYGYGYGSPDDKTVMDGIRSLAMVGGLLRKLRSTRFGIVGEHPEGMDSCHLDATTLAAKFGVTVESIPLAAVFTRSRMISEDQVGEIRRGLEKNLNNLGDLDSHAVDGTLKVYAALKAIAAEKSFAALAVRCWPEFFTELGCAACGAMSMLSDGFGGQTPLPTSCEADINGTLTQFILQTLSGKPAFGSDIVGVDKAADQIALWHCGLAPLSMADPEEQPKGTIHSNRQLPLLMDFTLKPGQVTIARISRATGDLKLVVGEGEMLRAPKPFSGTAGTLRLRLSAQRFLDALIHQGLEHHVSITYGHYLHPLTVFAEWINLPVILLNNKEVIG